LEDGIAMFDKILVPLDCSKFAENSLNVAIGVAKKFNSQLFLLHVFPAHDEYRRAGLTGKMRARERAHGAAKISEEIPKVCTDLLANSKRKVKCARSFQNFPVKVNAGVDLRYHATTCSHIIPCADGLFIAH